MNNVTWIPGLLQATQKCDHDASVEPITARKARSCVMRVLPSIDGSSGMLELVDESARKTRDSGATARLLRARSRSLSGARFAGERR